MLDTWQARFPGVFENYPQVMEADEKTLNTLDQLLNQLGSKGLINQCSLPKVLKVWSSYCRESFIALLNQVLSDKTFKDVLEQINYDFGFCHAIDLFELSRLDYDKNRQDLIMLTHLFANPLCRVIYDARLRCFSDYTETSEPISQKHATSLIKTLRDLEGEYRYEYFFNQLAKLRSFPPTQKYIDSIVIDIRYMLVEAFRLYCASIANSNVYIETHRLIQLSRQNSEPYAAQRLLDLIKYDVAAEIESMDLYSDREYQQLMDDIARVWQASNLLNDFSQILISSPQAIRQGSAELRRMTTERAKPVSVKPVHDEQEISRLATIL